MGAYLNRRAPLIVDGGLATDSNCCCGLCQWVVVYAVDCETGSWSEPIGAHVALMEADEGYKPLHPDPIFPDDPERHCAWIAYGEPFDCATPEIERPAMPSAPPWTPTEANVSLCCSGFKDDDDWPWAWARACYVVHIAPRPGKYYLQRVRYLNTSCDGPIESEGPWGQYGDPCSTAALRGEWVVAGLDMTVRVPEEHPPAFQYGLVRVPMVGCRPAFEYEQEFEGPVIMHHVGWVLHEAWGPYNSPQEFDALTVTDPPIEPIKYLCLASGFAAKQIGDRWIVPLTRYPTAAACAEWCGTCCTPSTPWWVTGFVCPSAPPEGPRYTNCETASGDEPEDKIAGPFCTEADADAWIEENCGPCDAWWCVEEMAGADGCTVPGETYCAFLSGPGESCEWNELFQLWMGARWHIGPFENEPDCLAACEEEPL